MALQKQWLLLTMGVLLSLAAPVHGQTVLFSTFPGIGSSVGITSQNFTDIAGFLTQGADDFTVPSGGWTIATVEVRGQYLNVGGDTLGPADSVNVYILGDAGGLPDTTNLSAAAIYSLEGASFVDTDDGDFLITLPGGGVSLPAGTYWLVVQANQASDVAGQWLWTVSGSSSGAESAFFETQELFAAPACTASWGARVSTCLLDGGAPSELDLAFELAAEGGGDGDDDDDDDNGEPMALELETFTME